MQQERASGTISHNSIGIAIPMLLLVLLLGLRKDLDGGTTTTGRGMWGL